ncbi:MAG: trehalose-phosphatase [marine benthic group bacterium]|nr:trehalose-phosphatase [Gemmatimonadota bacterium]
MSTGLEYALRHAAEAERLLVAFDFDGTLSPIVSNYETAAPDADALETLYALAALPRTRAIVISGRAREDLEGRLENCPDDVELIGSHGAEFGSDQHETLPAVEGFASALEGIAERFPGARLERKPISLAFHFRNVTDGLQEEARAEAIERVGDSAVAVKDGKKVVEFFALQADKGTALQRYREAAAAGGESPTVTVYVGDDVTDEAAFEALGPEDVGIRVGDGPSAARHSIEMQEEVAPLLRRLHRLRSEVTSDG